MAAKKKVARRPRADVGGPAPGPLQERVAHGRGDAGARERLSTGQLRLQAQQVAGSRCRAAAEVVAHLGAMQAQDAGAARWAVGLRLPGSTEDHVQRALDDGAVVRMHALRGTWQLVARDDVRWLVSLVAPGVLAAAARRHRELGIDDATRSRARTVLERALTDGTPRTRTEMGSLLDDGGVSPEGQRLPHLLATLELELVLCGGPRRGKRETWVLLDARVPAAPARSRADAVHELAQRYVRSRWPATADDFVWWSGLPAAEARAAFAHVSPPAPSTSSTDPRAHLLPAFDEFLIGYKDRSDVLDPAHVKRINAGGGLLDPVVVMDGHVVGTWRRTQRARHVDVEVAPFAALAARDRAALEDAAARYAAYLSTTKERAVSPEVTFLPT